MNDKQTSTERGSWTRRGWLSAATLGVTGTALAGAVTGTPDAGTPPPQLSSDRLPLTEFQPKSMLHVEETHVPRARFPAIDFHTHVSPRARSTRRTLPPADLVPVMDAVNVRTMVNV